MTTLVQGCVTVTVPEGITIPVEAGTLSDKQMSEMFPARYGVSLVCAATADAMRKNPARLAVPQVDADVLQALGQQASHLKQIATDVDVVIVKLRQAIRLLDHSAHTELRKVLAAVRALENFDPTLTDLVPDLVRYFENPGAGKKKTAEESAPVV